MELTVRSRNGKVTERQRQHIDEKLNKLTRYMDGINSATVEVLNEQLRSTGESYRVQVTLVGEHGVILRAEEQASDLFSAVDQVQQVLERQIKRYKEKYWRRGRGRKGEEFTPVEAEPAPTAIASPESDEEQPAPVVIRTKQFSLRPMFVDDAIEQMELLGHTFFVFQDAESSRMAVLYRRRDGNYGLIVPD